MDLMNNESIFECSEAFAWKEESTRIAAIYRLCEIRYENKYCLQWRLHKSPLLETFCYFLQTHDVIFFEWIHSPVYMFGVNL